MRANAHAHIQRDHTQTEMKIERRGGENKKKDIFKHIFLLPYKLKLYSFYSESKNIFLATKS